MPLWLKNYYIKIIRQKKGELLFLSTRYSVPFIGLFCNFFVLRFISPDELGVVQTAFLIPSYLGFLHFGVFNGLLRNFAIFQAQNRIEKLQRIVNAGWLVGKLVSIAGGIIAVGMILYFILSDKQSIYIWASFSVLGFLIFNPLQEFKF